VALARATCVYCGAPLETAASAGPPAPAAEAPAPKAVEAQPRVLVLLDLAAAPPPALAEALAVSRYEAELLVRRGGVQLVRAADAAAAAGEAERLRGLGAAPMLVPEPEVRAPPILCLSGERQDDLIAFRTTEGPRTLGRGEALILVRGAIAREYQASPERRRISSARLEDGFRVHVHLRDSGRPLELDALNLEVGFAASGSVRLELDAWLEAVAGDAPRDDGFRHLPPALAPQAPEPKSALSAAGALSASTRAAAGAGKAPLVLDNLAQFRFYSGCLAAVARRRC
jgi:hypothetical protein